ncbi:MAG: toxin-antitoxin system YwqK family antitoxin [Bacteroidetes bacterium]|nr:toxin-antitoxin system YwqK family antitoxin [Bacteroidota bacterium]
MKYLLILFILIWSTASSQTDGPMKFYYPNGKVSSEGNFKNNQPDGYWKAYYETGILKSEGNRLEGKLDSLWKFYDEKGNKTSDIQYRDGLKNGWQRDYFPTGTVYLERWMVNGAADSIANYYSEKGFLAQIIPLSGGVENGIAKEFAEDGRIVTLTTYKNGFFVKQEKINRYDKFGFKQGVWKEFYPSGVVKEDGTWKDDVKNGIFRWLTPDGIVKKMEIWKNGSLVEDELANVKLDIKREYHNTGRPKSSVNIINGVKEGVYREFDKEGNITISKLYEKDKIIAEGGTVDPQGRQQGMWKYYYPDGSYEGRGQL